MKELLESFRMYNIIDMRHKQMANLCSSTTSIHPCDFHPHEDLVEHTFQAVQMQVLQLPAD